MRTGESLHLESRPTPPRSTYVLGVLGAVGAGVCAGLVATLVTRLLEDKSWPAALVDGLGFAVIFCLIDMAILLLSVRTARRVAAGTTYDVSGGELRGGPPADRFVVPVSDIADLVLAADGGSWARQHRAFSPNVIVTTRAGDRLVLPPLTVWSRDQRQVRQRALRRAVGLPPGAPGVAR